MSSVTSYYYDGAIVQALTVSVSGDAVEVKDARTFLKGELEQHLSVSKDKKCILCYNSPTFHQDIVHLPPATARHYDTLVRAEVQKAHPELKSFAIFRRTIGETLIDGVAFNKIVVFSYADEFLSDFISVFNRHGREITHFYAAPYCIFRMANAQFADESGQSRIFIAALPEEKVMLACDSNELEFVRKIPSTEAALLLEDTHSINMTLDYCFQSLRIKPLEVLMLDSAGKYDRLAQHISVPFRSALPPRLAGVPEYIVSGYVAPLAAALHYAESPKTGDIRPGDYAAFSRNKKLLSALSMLLFAAAIVITGYLAVQRMATADLKGKSAGIRTALNSAAAEMAAYKKLDAEATILKKPIDMINRHNTAISPASALAALVLPPSSAFSVKKVSVQGAEGGLIVKIDGDITATTFSETQTIYEKAVEQIGKIPGYAVSSSSVDVKTKTFSAQAKFSGTAKQKP